VLVALAATGLKTARRLGKVRRVPPPATALTMPAAKAARQRNNQGERISAMQIARISKHGI
jgi:hypothetical protein